MGNLDRKLQRWNWLERDTAIQVLTLDSIDWSKQRIADYLGITRNQVRWAIARGTPTPRKPPGRVPKLIRSEVDDIITFITTNEINRRLSYEKLINILSLNISVDTLRRTLASRGYNRRVALGRPDIKEKNLLERLTWARAHVNWTRDDWCRIIWTDETWVTPGYHRKVRVTRRADEERHPDCLRPRRRKCYISYIAPLMEGFFRLRKDRNPIVMQDNAPGHSAKETIEYFEELGVCIMAWPVFSPDLNPIGSVWNWMKYWIEEKYGDQYMTPTILRGVVRDAWDAVPEDFLNGLIESMPARCQAVIDAQGGATKY
ncbi:hypothetical protein PDIG_55890 [Penicillium digitatum PHI26]|uniref:Transposable element tc1 transposase n=1 Tax=Penicillium digitatum (strain PHI26 / CECT 20796) TaxID=1170229 RepID=K9FMS2_PEND2|nr:hypothetical protein PDIG_55890 [Penicillium digitatum PHI26]